MAKARSPPIKAEEYRIEISEEVLKTVTMSTINITDSYISSIFDDADSVAPNDIMENASSMATNDLIESYIPSYIAEDAWQPWDVDEVCPAGFTCASMGDSSLGAFSCDESESTFYLMFRGESYNGSYLTYFNS